MGLADFIEKVNQANRPTSQLPPEKHGTTGNVQPIKGETRRDKVRTDKPKPEKLQFLKPYPVCNCRIFIYGQQGDFFCSHSQPGQPGQVVIAAGEREPDRQQDTDAGQEPEPTGRQSKEKERTYFDIALPWLMKHLAELQQTGWTRPELFRRSRYRWPLGLWGVAWLSVWSKPNLQVEIDRRTGSIRFTFTTAHGGQIIQTAYPNHHRVVEKKF